MFSLLITVIALVLVGLLAGATIYYVNNSADNRWNAIANQPISQAKQIHAAIVLQRQDLGENGTLTSLVPNYLSSMPTPNVDAYAKGVDAPTSEDWEVLSGDIKGIALVEKLSTEACEAVNRIMNKTDEIKTSPDKEFIVCYGTSQPYTFLLNFKAKPSAVIDAGEVPVQIEDEQLESLLELIGGNPFERIDEEVPAPEAFNAPLIPSSPGFVSTRMGVAQTVNQPNLGADLISASLKESIATVNTNVQSTSNVSFNLSVGSVGQGSYEARFFGSSGQPLAKATFDVLNPANLTSLSTNSIDFAQERKIVVPLEIQGENLDPYLRTGARVKDAGKVRVVKAYLVEQATGTARPIRILENTGSAAIIEIKAFPSGAYNIRWEWPNGEVFDFDETLTLTTADLWSSLSTPISEMNYTYHEGPGVAQQVADCGSCRIYIQELTGGTWSVAGSSVGTVVNPDTGFTRRYYRLNDPFPSRGPRTVRMQLKSSSLDGAAVYSESTIEFTPQINPIPTLQAFASLPSGLSSLNTFESFNLNESRTAAMFHNVGTTTNTTLNGTFLAQRTGPNAWGELRKIVDKNYAGIVIASYFAGDVPIDVRFNPPGHPLSDDGLTSTNVVCAIRLDVGPDAVAKNEFITAQSEGRTNCYDTGSVTPSSSVSVNQTNGKIYYMKPSTKYTFSVDSGGVISDYARIPTNVNVTFVSANTNSRGFVSRAASNGVVYTGPVVYYYADLGIYNLPPVASGPNIMGYYAGSGIKHPLDLLNMDMTLDYETVHALGGDRLLTLGSSGTVSNFPVEPVLVDVWAKTMQFLPGFRMNPALPNYTGNTTYKSMDQTPAGEVFVLTGTGFFGYNVQGTPLRVAPEVVSNPTPAALSANPASGVFGTVALGESKSVSLTLTNTGSMPYVQSSAVSSNALVEFTQDCERVEPGASCRITLSAFSNEPASLGGSLVITGTTGASLNIPFSGSVVAPNINVSPASVVFENVEVGDVATRTVELENVGQIEWKIELEKLNGETELSASHSCGTTLSPGATCEVKVSYSPVNTAELNEVLRATKTVGPTTVSLTSRNVVEADSTPNTLAISAGYHSDAFRSVSLKPDGSLYYLGANWVGSALVSDWTLIDTGVARFHVGPTSVVYVKQDGNVYGLGALPTASGMSSVSTPTLISSQAKAAWAGLSKVFVHKTNGTIEAAGSNYVGSMGAGPLGDRQYSAGFVPVFTTASEVVSLYPAPFATLMLLGDGTVWIAGGDASGIQNSVWPVRGLYGRAANANLRVFSQIASGISDMHFNGLSLYLLGSNGSLSGSGSTAFGALGNAPVSTAATPSNFEQGFVAMASGVSQIAGGDGSGLMVVEGGVLKCSGVYLFCGQSASIKYIAFQDRVSVVVPPGISGLLDSGFAGPALTATAQGLIYQLGGPARTVNGESFTTSTFKQIEVLP